ncbi:hypothetical protein QBC47DRAFT_386963 [Echria macrotheca]|uniref:Uncharacterized protein n=1 Tax=Echria macrotheca TaxID=438768 RepID=A0AAJ0F3P3_9PEZI|nr:hypothetical protein QBC47DRAFT_386963 [Echria macrotheca]
MVVSGSYHARLLAFALGGGLWPMSPSYLLWCLRLALKLAIASCGLVIMYFGAFRELITNHAAISY